MKSIPLRLFTALLFSIPLTVGSLAGCSDAPPSHDASEKTGTLSAALSTVGPDGATYKFVQGSELVLVTGGLGAAYQFDHASTLFQRRLPVGDYTLDVVFGQYGSMPVLEKTLDNVTELVFPEWTDPHPLAFAIVDGQVTSVALHFNVKGLGNLTFASGTLEVTAEVAKETVNQATSIEQTANLTVGSVTFADPNAAYVAPLSLPEGSVHSQGLTVATTGTWALHQSEGVCVQVSVTGTAWSRGSEALRRRLAHVIAGTGTACIQDGGALDTLKIVVSASGPAPADQQSFLPDPDYHRTLVIQGSIPDVFDGSNFQQSTLESSVPLTSGLFWHRIFATAPAFTELTSMFGQLDGSVRFRADM
jgi:hypothetical protein